jgi:nitrogen regulatory protein P-II 1
MKKIEAIIRKSKFDDVKEALAKAGIDFFSFWDVRGIGKARQGRVYRGVMYDTSTIERAKLSIIVRDKNVEKTVLAIMQAARTGEIGDGKIFISNIEESYRIRTGEYGEESLYIKEEED